VAIVLKPILSFELAGKKVIQCRVVQGMPHEALNHTLIYRDGKFQTAIRLTGMSTAWSKDGTIDFVCDTVFNVPASPSSDATITGN
jgi:hypothetical protein